MKIKLFDSWNEAYRCFRATTFLVATVFVFFITIQLSIFGKAIAFEPNLVIASIEAIVFGAATIMALQFWIKENREITQEKFT